MKATSELSRLRKENEQLRIALKELQSVYLTGFTDGYNQASTAASRIIDVLSDRIRVLHDHEVCESHNEKE